MEKFLQQKLCTKINFRKIEKKYETNTRTFESQNNNLPWYYIKA